MLAVEKSALEAALRFITAREEAVSKALEKCAGLKAESEEGDEYASTHALFSRIKKLEAQLIAKEKLCEKLKEKVSAAERLLAASHSSFLESSEEGEGAKASLLARLTVLAREESIDEGSAAAEHTPNSWLSPLKDNSPAEKKVGWGRKRSASMHQAVQKVASPSSISDLSPIRALRTQTSASNHKEEEKKLENIANGYDAAIELVREFDKLEPSEGDSATFKWKLEGVLSKVEEIGESESGEVDAVEDFCFRSLYWRLFQPPLEVQERDRLLLDRAERLSSFLQLSHLGFEGHREVKTEKVMGHATSGLATLPSMRSPAAVLACICRVASLVTVGVSVGGQTALERANPVSADDFVPALIFALVNAHLPRLASIGWFVETYCRDALKRGENWYYFTNFQAAVSFVEHVTASSISMDEGVFEMRMKGGK